MATTLNQGDIALIHVQSDTPDTISFLLLVGVDASTSINFTDNGVNGAGQIATGTEGTLTWTSGTAMSAGTVVTMTAAGAVWSADAGAVVKTGGFALSASGDQVLVYQGPVAGAGDTPALLFGFHSNVNGTTDPATHWNLNSGTSNTSQLPASLAGFEVAFDPEVDNASYNGITTGSKAQLMAAITDDANWTTSNTALPPPSFGPFSVNDPAIAVDDAVSTGEDTVLGPGDVFADNGSGADNDPENDPFSVTAVNGNGASVGSQITLASGALLTVNADGTFSYDPNGNFNHLPGPLSGASNLTDTDTFTYTITGGDTATVTVTINGVDSNDTLQGTPGVDTLSGGAGNDFLEGLASGDVLDGGAGVNFATYNASGPGLVVDLATPANSTGDAAGDTYVNIQRFSLSPNDDSFVGDGGGNYAVGGAGADTLSGGAGRDTLLGGDGGDTLNGDAGRDTLIAGAGADTLNGGADNDVLFGEAGGDALDGGAGAGDIAAYSTSGSAVVVDLSNTANNTGDAAGDSYVSIERFLLTGFDDSFTGTGAADFVLGGDGVDTLNGAGGDDKLFGGAGADTLNGSDGNDQLFGGAGGDTLNGGAGTDVVFYTDATSAVTVDLATPANNTGDAAGDTYTSIERFVLSAFDDVFAGGTGDVLVVAGAGNDALSGGTGADKLLGGAGIDTISGRAGNDKLFGGDGADTLSGGAGADKLFGDAGNDTLSGGGADGVRDQFFFATGFGADTISDFQINQDDILFQSIAGITQFSDLALSDDGSGNAVIDAGGGNTVTLTGVDFNLLDAGDFQFL